MTTIRFNVKLAILYPVRLPGNHSSRPSGNPAQVITGFRLNRTQKIFGVPDDQIAEKIFLAVAITSAYICIRKYFYIFIFASNQFSSNPHTTTRTPSARRPSVRQERARPLFPRPKPALTAPSHILARAIETLIRLQLTFERTLPCSWDTALP